MVGGNTSVVGSDESGHSVSVDGLPKSALSAIIRKLNERSQRTSRIFRDDYDISLQDIKNLIEKVTQEFHSCTIISANISVSLLMSNSQRFDFVNWSDFLEFDTSQPERTRSLSVRMAYDVLREEGGLPERYIAQISVQNTGRDVAFSIGMGDLPNFETLEIFGGSLSTMVEFNNYILGKNIMGTVESWEKSLDRYDRKAIRLLQSWSRRIRDVMILIAVISGIYFCRVFLAAGQLETTSTDVTANWIYHASFVVIAFWALGSVAGEFAEKAIDRNSAKSNIMITNGDKKRNSKISKKNRDYALQAAGFITLSLIQLLTSVMANPIWEYIRSSFGL